jgi:hypothetical protein
VKSKVAYVFAVVSALWSFGGSPLRSETLPVDQPESETASTALSLEQAVDESVHHNLDLLAAQYNVPMARAD